MIPKILPPPFIIQLYPNAASHRDLEFELCFIVNHNFFMKCLQAIRVRGRVSLIGTVFFLLFLKHFIFSYQHWYFLIVFTCDLENSESMLSEKISDPESSQKVSELEDVPSSKELTTSVGSSQSSTKGPVKPELYKEFEGYDEYMERRPILHTPPPLPSPLWLAKLRYDFFSMFLYPINPFLNKMCQSLTMNL